MTVRAAAETALARCIEPVNPSAFFERYWESEPLHLERGEAGWHDDLLSEEDVRRAASTPALRHPGFRLVKAGEQIPLSAYSAAIPWRPSSFTGAIDVEAAWRAFDGGATLVLQALHHTWPPLRHFCRDLERELGHPAQANAYYTPAHSQGLAVHHDTHDVFVLQVSGRKRWRIYDPVLELPLRNQRYRPELGGPGEPRLDLTLGPGDMLYMPRGWLHEALTSGEHSLHLTIGVNVYTWIDAVRAAVEACADEPGFRRAPSPDGDVEALLARLESELSWSAVARRARRRFVRTRRPILDDYAEQLEAARGLTLATPVRRRRTVIFDFDGATLVFEGKLLRFPPHAREELEALVDAEQPVLPAELPGRLDDDGRLVLVRRLVREAFLTVDE